MKTGEWNNAVFKRIVIYLFITGVLTAANVQARGLRILRTDTSVKAEIDRQLNDGAVNSGLYFPLSTRRFYITRNFAPVWTLDQKDQNKTWAAMLLVDCVLQFGLRHGDYHPKDQWYPLLHKILEQPDKIISSQKRATKDTANIE